MKNLCAKTRKLDNAYEVWKGIGRFKDWEWRVLKKYQNPEREAENKFARWFCAVQSPFTQGGWDYGDTYIKDVVSSAKIHYAETKPNLKTVMR